MCPLPNQSLLGLEAGLRPPVARLLPSPKHLPGRMEGPVEDSSRHSSIPHAFVHCSTCETMDTTNTANVILKAVSSEEYNLALDCRNCCVFRGAYSCFLLVVPPGDHSHRVGIQANGTLQDQYCYRWDVFQTFKPLRSRSLKC